MVNLLTIYRVENEDGVGPFQEDDCHTFHAFRMPTPPRDNMPDPPRAAYNYIFGFQSAQLYRRWFTYRDRRRLQTRDYYLAVYEISLAHCLLGENQVAFVRDAASRITIRPLVQSRRRSA